MNNVCFYTFDMALLLLFLFECKANIVLGMSFMLLKSS